MLLALLLGNLIFTTYITLEAEKVIITRNSILFLVISSLLFIAICFCLKSRVLERISLKCILLIGSGVWLLFGLFLLLNSDGSMRADAKYVFEGMLKFKNGDLSAFTKGGEISNYPNNLGLLVREYVVSFVSESPYWFFFLNLVDCILCNVLLTGIVRTVAPDHMALQNATALLGFLFLPQLFYILFVYGNLPGMFWLLFSVYLLVRSLIFNKLQLFIGSVVAAAFAGAIRINYLIPYFALFIVFGLHALETGRFIPLLAALSLFICAFFSGQLLQKSFYRLHGEDGFNAQYAFPMVTWLVIGTETGEKGPGWYNSYPKDLMEGLDYDAAAATEIAQQDLTDRIHEFQKDPKETLKFFAHKLCSTWSDPTFQSIWVGPQEAKGAQMNTPILQNLYTGESLYHIYDRFCKYIVLCVSAFALVGICSQSRPLPTWFALFCGLQLLGGLLFHLLWETKSQYVFGYVYLLIPLAASGICRLGKTYNQEKKSFR